MWLNLTIWATMFWFGFCAARAHHFQCELQDMLMSNAFSYREANGFWLRHTVRLLFLRNPMGLYGPLCQAVMNNQTIDARWWMIYKVYLGLPKHEQRYIRNAMARKDRPTLEHATFIITRMDIDHVIGWPKPVEENRMDAAALEYEEIMAQQELLQ